MDIWNETAEMNHGANIIRVQATLQEIVGPKIVKVRQIFKETQTQQHQRSKKNISQKECGSE